MLEEMKLKDVMQLVEVSKNISGLVRRRNRNLCSFISNNASAFASALE